DTRQLAAPCAVVDRRSFSQAAARLGVTQPAVSLQIRSLEQRVGQKLVDRSGRRVEATEAGLQLYQTAKRMLQMEEELLARLADSETGELRGVLRLGAATGPGGSVVPVLLCAFQRANPDLSVSLAIHDTQRVIELGLQESARSAVLAGYGITFISRAAVEAELEAGTLAAARVEGLEPRRQIVVARAAGRAPTRAAEAFLAFARERLA